MGKTLMRLLVLLGMAAVLPVPVALAGALPFGFAGVNVGDPWLLVKDRYPYRNVSKVANVWDRYAEECGSFSVLAELPDRTLYVSVHDFVVTSLSETLALSANRDLFELRQEAIEDYGPANTEVFKNRLGAETEDMSQVNYILLYYDVANPVRINISGAPLWRYQVRVEYKNRRLHENKGNRCVRQRQAQAGTP